jgi:hypothetical protein
MGPSRPRVFKEREPLVFELCRLGVFKKRAPLLGAALWDVLF